MAGERQITPVNDVNEGYPLSPMQQGMLFHSLSAPHSGVDIEQILCTLSEELNVAAFRQAWERVVERHSILRTGFRVAGLEPQQEVQEWNATETDFPRDKCVHELFETQVERTPNAVALVYNKEEVSYRELDNQAIRVARHLRSLGVGPVISSSVAGSRCWWRRPFRGSGSHSTFTRPSATCLKNRPLPNSPNKSNGGRRGPRRNAGPASRGFCATNIV